MIGGAEARTECLRSFRPEMFYIPAHRILFQTLAALTEKKCRSISDWLKSPWLEAVNSTRSGALNV
jgi:replicative DNA helicase